MLNWCQSTIGAHWEKADKEGSCDVSPLLQVPFYNTTFMRQ